MRLKLLVFGMIILITASFITYVYEKGRSGERERTRDANREAGDLANDRRDKLTACDGVFDYWTGRCAGAPEGDGR